MRYAKVSLASAILLATATGHADGGWTKVHERNGVVVSVRPRIGSPIYELGSVGDMDAPPERVYAVISDMERYPEFLPPTSLVKLLRRDGNSSLYYMEINPPVIARRDYCLRVIWEGRPEGGWHGSWAADHNNCLPERRGVVRMHENEGEWILEPLAGGLRTHFCVQRMICGASDSERTRESHSNSKVTLQLRFWRTMAGWQALADEIATWAMHALLPRALSAAVAARPTRTDSAFRGPSCSSYRRGAQPDPLAARALG